jgi:hypothetical protein
LYGHAAMKHRANFCFLNLVPPAEAWRQLALSKMLFKQVS